MSKRHPWTGKSGTGARKLKKRVKGIVDEVVGQLASKHGVEIQPDRVKTLKRRLVRASVELSFPREGA
jgi:hypothetical protein